MRGRRRDVVTEAVNPLEESLVEYRARLADALEKLDADDHWLAPREPALPSCLTISALG